jgi:hypothetical protein
VTGNWRCRNEELCDVCCLLNIFSGDQNRRTETGGECGGY